MSLQTLQLVLCRCAVDRTFRARLLAAPACALAPYAGSLTAVEIAALLDPPERSLLGLARAVEALRRGEDATFEYPPLERRCWAAAPRLVAGRASSGGPFNG